VVESETSHSVQVLNRKKAEKQAFQIETYSPDEEKFPQLFALGDSWLWQNEPQKALAGFSNLASSLKDRGYSFGTSANRYPPPADGWTNVFNRVGIKLAELPPLHAELQRRFEKVAKENTVVGAVLLSASGNDIAAHDKKDNKPDYSTAKLYNLLNENPKAQKEVFNQNAKSDFFGDLKKYYTGTLKILLSISQAPILIHGYDYPIPDGRPFLSKDGAGIGIGPWLQGVFDERKVDRAFHRIAMKELIVELNTLIASVAQDNEKVFSDVERARLRYVKLAGVLNSQADFGDPDKDVGYQKYWANEIHPTKLGFDILAYEVVKKLTAIGVASGSAAIASVKPVCPYK